MDQAQDKNPAIRFAQRRLENLKFFSRAYPSLYTHFKDFTLQRAEVTIFPAQDEVDLVLEGRSLYGGKGRGFASQEVEAFRSTFETGSRLNSISPPWPGAYYHPRFAHDAVDRAVRLSPLEQSSFTGYPIADFYPLVVFMGVGLGYQIEQIIKQHDVENAVILEPDTEVFAASLFTVDWERICFNFKKKGRSLNFLVGAKADEETLWPILINQLMHYCPIFPIMNFFLIHRADPVMVRVAERINREVITSLTSWGHYDDEIRQLNNALHAFHEGVKVIPPKGSISSNIPVLVIGSGPSLDSRLDDIRMVRSKVIIVSAGTGLSALLENDILPDFHVELESDYLNYRVLSSYDKDKLKKTRIVAASQICPLIWGLFSEARLYFKLENPIANVFGDEKETVDFGTPTCTNAALALCTQLGFSNLFLFGTDYGFRDHSKHHASKSVYMKSSDQMLGELLEQSVQTNFVVDKTFTIESVDGGVINTTPIYFSAKRTVDRLIRNMRIRFPNTCFHNCADGAKIEGTDWLDQPSFIEAANKSGSEPERMRVASLLFSPDARTVPTADITPKLDELEKKLKRLAAHMRTLCDKSRMRGKKDMTRSVSEIGRYLETVLIKEDQSLYFLVRGTIRHFLAVGFSHTMALENESEVKNFLRGWQSAFIQCLEALPDHFRKVTRKDYQLSQDVWVRQSINDPEEGLGLGIDLTSRP